jgi:hypothetical protein
MEDDQLSSMAKSAIGSHVLDAFFDSKMVSEVARRKMIAVLEVRLVSNTAGWQHFSVLCLTIRLSYAFRNFFFPFTFRITAYRRALFS